jgi:hypothetical protein
MINKKFNIAHIDLINTKIDYPSLDVLKEEVYPLDCDEAKTYIIDDKIIFACGIKWVRQGVGHCWVIPSVYVDKYPKGFYIEINKLLNEYSKKMNLHRIQTTITDDFVNWIEKLGFHRESVLEKITFDKKDEYMYVKFF